MDLTRLLVRMAMWLRRPPSRRHVAIMLVVLAASAVLVGIERLFGWPEALTTDRVPIRRM